MSVRLEVYNRFEDYCGVIPDEDIVVDAYASYPLIFRLYPKTIAQNYQIRINNHWLKRNGNIFRFELAGVNERGRWGFIRVYVYLNGVVQYSSSIVVIGENLKLEQYQFLLDDLQRIIRIASLDNTYINSLDLETGIEFLRIYDKQIQEISEFLEILGKNLSEIILHPQKKIVKTYYVGNSSKTQRLDSKTIRWNAKNAGRYPNRLQTYKTEESTNVYENQFIVFVLKWLLSYICQLGASYHYHIQQKKEEIACKLEDWKSFSPVESVPRADFQMYKDKRIKKLSELQKRINSLCKEQQFNYQGKIQNLTQKIRGFRNLVIFKDIEVISPFSIKPTLVLLREPAYNKIYKGYIELRDSLNIDEKIRLEWWLNNIPSERTSKLFEYWVLSRVYYELLYMGFRKENGSKGILDLINPSSQVFQSGSKLRLVGDANLYGDGENELVVDLWYEKRFGPNNEFCPDIYLEFQKEEENFVLILDAKYRNYASYGCPSYENDVQKTAKSKYLELRRPQSGKWKKITGVEKIRKSIKASFIIHSHWRDNDKFVDYGSSGNRNRYGAISLVPEERKFNSSSLKKLLKMFFRMHLDIHNICWSEGHQIPQLAEKIKPLGGNHREDREWEYHCPKCGNHWWVNHCGNCGKRDGINYTKISFSDPADNFFEVSDHWMNGKNLLKCSRCNEPYKG